MFLNKAKIIKLFGAKKFSSKGNFLFQEVENVIHFDLLNKKADPTGRHPLFYCSFHYCRSASKALIMDLSTLNNFTQMLFASRQTLPSLAPWWECPGLAVKLFPMVPIPSDWLLERLTGWQRGRRNWNLNTTFVTSFDSREHHPFNACFIF